MTLAFWPNTEQALPRMPRLDSPGVPQHVIQRGNDRKACFFGRTDYLRYLQALQDAATNKQCEIHAYVLMTNHVHLLVTPAEAGSVGRMMQMLGRKYVRGVNDARMRTGTLWEGRYKASLVDSERYLLACYRYIELNPVRAGMVPSPGEYPWSSYRCNADGVDDPLVQPHEVLIRLGADDAARREAYRELVAQGIADEELATIRLYGRRQRALGSREFQERIERECGFRAGMGRPGRPRKSQSC
jgi:putative transposase